jgi:nitrite reductase (NADH) small subunit
VANRETELIDVGALDDFPDRTIRIVSVAGRELGIVSWAGRFYALHNRCPHQAGPLCAGTLGPKIVCDSAGHLEVDPDSPVIACAWHRWEFYVQTGTAVWDPKYRAKTYPVEIRDGRVLVRLGARERAAAGSLDDVACR